MSETRFCLLTAFDFWVAWVANERQEGPPGSVQPGIKVNHLRTSQLNIHPFLAILGGLQAKHLSLLYYKSTNIAGETKNASLNPFWIMDLKAKCRDAASVGLRMWVIDTSRWPKPWQQSDRPYVPADRSERRGYWAKRRAMKLRLGMALEARLQACTH